MNLDKCHIGIVLHGSFCQQRLAVNLVLEDAKVIALREKEKEIVKRQIKELVSEYAEKVLCSKAEAILDSNLLKDEEIEDLIQDGRAYTMAIALINDWLLSLPYPLEGKSYKKLRRLLEKLR
ncbi:hypothetical protein BG32_13910 [Mesotoga sp. HF07.pep.5.2.highcov]|jgi:predicted kinase|nr:hypothetical protein V513_01600 [Mesotoga sp. H07.pep.5.3]RLL85764.1 hypothetical protein Y696_05780 [Mesotoga sp. H07pep.5.4]RLL90847.1 hypothetical protein BG32_13910 [Mesotoga sp. HF07.pep.5.2.highcov]CCU83752.1 conserved hypothetical protein [Mesotoga infera]